MTSATLQKFRCMMCGHEYERMVERGEDKERSCPECHSNSIRPLKAKPPATKE
jgi:putative FmdB family regulatory protein